MGKRYSAIDLYNKLLPSFEERYRFELCSEERIHDVVKFIDEYWKKNHIFVRSPGFLKWQLYNESERYYNIFLAVHKESNEIHAMEGFVTSSHFDSEIVDPFFWGCMWKNLRENEEPGLGFMVDITAILHSKAKAFAGFGISNDCYNVTRRNSVVGTADHFCIINPIKKYFQIADHVDSTRTCSIGALKSTKKIILCSMEQFVDINDSDLLVTIPFYKSKEYYVNRFFKHPIYDYHASAICNSDFEVLGIIFWRFCYHATAKCIRIVDYFGKEDALSGCLDAFTDMLVEFDAEYIDIICVNLPHKMLGESGFINRVSQPELVIPNYFEPFFRSNIDLRYAYSTSDPRLQDNICIYKGDSDQDRPS